ncbi:MAG: TIGR02147 family protein, partial [Chitinivibrionales bacterium]|nr:TIGR02147 family protein [Chitinivibrionales bacterium]
MIIFICMKPVTTYIDFRKFLSDYYEEKKRTTHHFSHRYFAQKAGISSSSFLTRVIDGRRNLTRPMIE